jgi:hypothetical protein
MRASHQQALVPSVAVIAFVVVAPELVEAQTMSARPTSISLTVVVPPRANDVSSLAIDDRAKIISRSATTFDLEKIIGLIDRPTSRIEVRRGAGWSADVPRVWVRNRRGEFESLETGTAIVAVDAPGSLARLQSPLRFRIDTDPATAPVAVPVEYRLTVGEGDQFTVWRFTSVIRSDSLR